MNAADFSFVCDLVYQENAIVLGPGKEYLVQTRLQGLARERGIAGVDELIRRLRAERFSSLRLAVCEAMTTNETSFFRDRAPFVALRETLIPEAIARNASRRTLRIWSAASSTGQEAYSIAITLREHFPQLAGWDIQILGTDYTQPVLEQASAGRYSRLDVSRGLSEPLRDRYFRADDAHWVARDTLRQLVRFQRCNLTGMWPTTEKQDIILLRNVLIYFDDETRRRILVRMSSLLHPEGALMLGSAESPMCIHKHYTRRPLGRVLCYQPLQKRLAVAG